MLRLHRKLPEHVRSKLRGKFLYTDEIHIERIEETYSKLVKWLRNHRETMLMLTFSPRKPSKKTLNLYKELISVFPNPVGLHVHICDDLYSPPLPLPSGFKQYEVIKSGLEYLRKLGVETRDFTSGHWSYNEATFIVCKQLGLTNVHIRCKHIPEITEKYGIPKGIRLIPVVRHLHDYDL